MTKNVILLVDDDPVFTQFTQNVLVEKDMKVVTAFNKAEGLDMFERHRPSCVILDIFLPDGSGVDLIKPMRSEFPNVPVIMVSGQSEVDEVVRAMKEGASDYIKKPFRGEELLIKIQMVLDSTKTKWELESLKTQVRADEEYRLLFSLSDRMNKVQAIVDQVANTDITVLVTGESGTGKELVAKALHKASDRAGEPFIKVNCLHVLQEKQFYRIGGEREVKVNCRIITATNKKLEDMVDEGRFRRDLFYRINVVNIVVPPLRDRRDDIPLLSDYFLKRYEEMYNRDSLTISPRLMDMFLKYAWPGNVRELENNIKRLIILGNEAQLIAEMERKREDAPPVLIPGGDGGYLSRPEAIDRIPAMNFTAGYGDNDNDIPERATLKEVSKIAQRNAERDVIDRVLRQTRWNRRKAAQILDISYKALLYKIKECGLNQE
jgi:DNA-binding NtrC family response regulator